VIAHAFDPFFTTKPTGEGTGLGLSMTYGFVQQSGGHVLLSSEEGQGTMVSIYLPRHLGTADGEGEVDGKSMPSHTEAGAVVLLVEDEPAVRMVVVEVLSDLGYTVLEADNSQSGLRIVETRARIDLLLTDVGLTGGMNGRQLADAARELRPGLKVLFLTGYAENAAVGNGRMEEGMEVITKPFDLDKLVAKVEGMISR
jgi:CheY-like chemotaxis protein